MKKLSRQADLKARPIPEKRREAPNAISATPLPVSPIIFSVESRQPGSSEYPIEDPATPKIHARIRGFFRICLIVAKRDLIDTEPERAICAQVMDIRL